MNKVLDKSPPIIISGACLNFEKERKKIIGYIEELELVVRLKIDCEVSSTGNSFGWEFFQIYFDPMFIEKLTEIYHDIINEEGVTLEQQFVLWLSKQFKKKNLDYNLKLTEIPYESTRGFRLDPNNYRDDSLLEDLK